MESGGGVDSIDLMKPGQGGLHNCGLGGGISEDEHVTLLRIKKMERNFNKKNHALRLTLSIFVFR